MQFVSCGFAYVMLVQPPCCSPDYRQYIEKVSDCHASSCESSSGHWKKKKEKW